MGTTVSEGDEVSNEDVTKDKLEKDSSGDAPPVSRENLISTAVRFLENTKIRSTSVELKTSFLKKKGLTDEEIATAFKQVSTLEEKQSTTSTTMVEPGLPGLPVHPNPGYLAPFLPTAIPQGYPMSKKIRDILNVVLLIGGFSYGINYLWRKYIRAWWYGIEKPSPNEILLQTSQTLLSTVLTLKEGMEKLQASLDSINGNETRSKNEVSDLKKEVMSLKGLLLSRRLRPRQSPSTSTSLISRGYLVQSEPSTPAYMTGLFSPSGSRSPAGSQTEEVIMSPEPEYYGNNPEKVMKLIEDIDD